MRARDCFLRRLGERSGGRVDRTVHAYLHVAIPLGISLTEMERCVNDLVALGLIEANPGFERLVRLTPLGVAACKEIGMAEITLADSREETTEWHGFIIPRNLRTQIERIG